MPVQLASRDLVLPPILGGVAAGVGLLAGVRPELAVGAALALAFLFLLVNDLVMGLCAFVLLTFLEILATPGAGLIKGAGVVLAVGWIAAVATREQIRPRIPLIRENTAFFGALALFLGWTAISLTWADNTGDAKVAVLRFVLDAALAAIVFTAVRRRRHVVWLYWAFAGGCVLSVVVGLILGPEESTDTTRLQGAGVDPNTSAIVLVAGMILAGAVAVTSKPGLSKIAAGGVSFLCGAGVLLTFSRTGLVTLTLALIGGLMFAGRNRGRTAIVAVLVTISAVGYFAVLAPPEARERITTAGSGSGRIDLWTVAGRMIADRPTLGVGAGNFPSASFDYALEPGQLDTGYLVSPTGLLQVVHNSYLEVLAELGAVGFALYVPLLILPMVAASRAARNFARMGDGRMETLARALMAAQLGMLGGAVFTSLEYSKQLWLLLALGPALLSLSVATQRRAEGP